MRLINFITNCKDNKIVILSHFHADHAKNAFRLNVPIYCF